MNSEGTIAKTTKIPKPFWVYTEKQKAKKITFLFVLYFLKSMLSDSEVNH